MKAILVSFFAEYNIAFFLYIIKLELFLETLVKITLELCFI